MKTLYLDCSMGAAGDMLTAALLELLPEPDKFLEELNGLGIPGVRYRREPSAKCGIWGTHITVTVNGSEEGEAHAHDHAHDHHDHEHKHAHEHDHHEHAHEHHAHEHHHHSSLAEIAAVVAGLALPEAVKEDVMAVYDLIAGAESRAHGVEVGEVHFHEVGAMDAVADVAAVCLLMHRLAPGQVVVSPIQLGSGQVECAHGILPVPAPATAHILRGLPVCSGSIRGELCTPTGAALLKHFATGFGAMPLMQVEAIGYGMGKKDFPAANCLRAFWGESVAEPESVAELACNLDDMTGEELGFAMEALYEAGALEVYTTPVGMKKCRPGVLLTVLCRPEDKNRLAEAIFRHTTTLGVRENTLRRYTLARREETLETPLGRVRLKYSAGCGVEREKYEYDDLARIAREEGCGLAEVKKRLDKRL